MASRPGTGGRSARAGASSADPFIPGGATGGPLRGHRRPGGGLLAYRRFGPRAGTGSRDVPSAAPVLSLAAGAPVSVLPAPVMPGPAASAPGAPVWVNTSAIAGPSWPAPRARRTTRACQELATAAAVIKIIVMIGMMMTIAQIAAGDAVVRIASFILPPDAVARFLSVRPSNVASPSWPTGVPRHAWSRCPRRFAPGGGLVMQVPAPAGQSRSQQALGSWLDPLCWGMASSRVSLVKNVNIASRRGSSARSCFLARLVPSAGGRAIPRAGKNAGRGQGSRDRVVAGPAGFIAALGWGRGPGLRSWKTWLTAPPARQFVREPLPGSGATFTADRTSAVPEFQLD